MNVKHHLLETICKILLIAGAINWGLVGLFDLNLVKLTFSFSPLLEKVVYCLVGLSGLYVLYRLMNAEAR